MTEVCTSETGVERLPLVIRAAMADRGLSQAAVSDQTGIPTSTLSRRLSGQGRAFLVTELKALAECLGLEVSELAQRASSMCPDWCVEHETAGRDGAVTIHNGERQAPRGFTVAFDGGPAEPLVMYLTRSTTPEGHVCDDGLMVSGRLQDGRAFLGDLLHRIQRSKGVQA